MGAAILLLGATGQLGLALRRELERRRVPVLAPSRSELDLAVAGRAAAAVLAARPSAVLNAAAYTDVARAELAAEQDAVRRLNEELPGELGAACAAIAARLVHVSTDYVFDGAKGAPYREDDPTRPLQVYGRSKLAGERAALEAAASALVVRTSTLYGSGRESRPNYVDAILRQAREHRRLEVVRAPVASPTYAPDLALALLDLLEAGATGVVHVVNAGACSRLELAAETLRVAGLAERVELRERSEPPGTLRRPAWSVLDTSRFGGITGRPMRPWQAALAEHVRGE
jgi:dTDP-4-dehydrorhamnose reductase